MRKFFMGIALSFLSIFAFADEGMWLMTFIDRLKYTDWQKEGLNLTPEEIYSINNASLKDAIVSFGGYCTGEMISDQGLILTNHHCGYGVIAELSNEENDYLKDGYWAMDKSQELKPENLYVRYLVRMDDVTNRIVQKLNPNMSEEERQNAIQAEYKLIETENSEGGKYVVSTKSFYGGNEFYYFVYQDYTDVRFVGAPPSSIGKYGGDTDNWEWPRHTGDFSLFRVYADANGNPAEYSTTNVPLKPKHSLPVKTGGVKPGDFAMTIGYPGSTERYMPSYGIEQAVNVEYPAWIKAANTAMEAMKKHMDNSDKIRIDYAAKYSQIANYWKNRIGMIEALNKLNTKAKKVEYENDFQAWVNADAARKKKYGNVLNNMKDYYSKTNNQVENVTYLVRGFLSGSRLALNPFIMGRMMDSYKEQTPENQAMMMPQLLPEIQSRYEGMDLATEKDILADLLKVYVADVDPAFQLAYIKEINTQYNGDFQRFVNEATANSVLTSASAAENAFKNNTDFTAEPLYKLSNAIFEAYQSENPAMIKLEDNYNKSYRLFIDGLRQTYPDRIFFPDANSTMRLSTGKVLTLPNNPEKPNDATSNYYTTLKGAMLKYQPGDEEFDQPLKLMQLYNKQDYGSYADADGTLHVNFLTDNDITGGNSGSPVIGGNGELIGLAFDGNWEAMSGDIEFEEELQRTINVDIRYVLFIIDKYAGAKHLIDEMKLVP